MVKLGLFKPMTYAAPALSDLEVKTQFVLCCLLAGELPMDLPNKPLLHFRVRSRASPTHTTLVPNSTLVKSSSIR